MKTNASVAIIVIMHAHDYLKSEMNLYLHEYKDSYIHTPKKIPVEPVQKVF